jgi:hypothetical protein
MSFIKKTMAYLKQKKEMLTLLDNSWENKIYDFYLIFGQTDKSKSPWIKSNWDTDFEPYFDSLLKQVNSYKETGIKVIKYVPEKRFAKKDNKEFIYYSELKSGKLRWNVKSHEKWTIPADSDIYFQNFELWTPIWTVCEQQDSPPDIFISISNERDTENTKAVKFGYLIVVAISKKLAIDSKSIVRDLSEKIKPEAAILKTRKWGKPEKTGDWTFVNWIQDTCSNGIYREKSLHSFEFQELEFEPVWEIIYKQE